MKILFALFLAALPTIALAETLECVGEAQYDNRHDKVHTIFNLQKTTQLFYKLSFWTGFHGQTFYAACSVHPNDGRLFDCKDDDGLRITSSHHSVERVSGTEDFIEIQGRIPAGLSPAQNFVVKFDAPACEVVIGGPSR